MGVPRPQTFLCFLLRRRPTRGKPSGCDKNRHIFFMDFGYSRPDVCLLNYNWRLLYIISSPSAFDLCRVKDFMIEVTRKTLAKRCGNCILARSRWRCCQTARLSQEAMIWNNALATFVRASRFVPQGEKSCCNYKPAATVQSRIKVQIRTAADALRIAIEP